MKFSVERASDIDQDLDAIFDFLVESYQTFGDSREAALERTTSRLRAIEKDMMALSNAPHQGTLRPNLMPGVRSVTKNRAIFYFELDEEHHVLRVLAVFFGGQDHVRRMLVRLLGKRLTKHGTR